MRLRLLGLLTSVLLLPTSIRVLDVIHAEAGAVAGPFVAVQPSATGAPVVPFRIRVPDNVLQDLQVRLGRSRFPDEIPGSGWEYGADLTYMKQLVSYWRDTFNWRTQEQRLNRFPQFKTNIDGLDLHFVHQRATTADAVPLVLLHGYPDSFVTFTRVIDALADPASHGGQPEEAFHVVVPSLPGYGFSERPRQHGWGATRAAAAVTTLMARLGYTRYAVQGAGLGCVIGTRMALHDGARVLGEHFNDCSVPAPPGDPEAGVPPADLQRMRAREAELASEQAYLEMNSKKPHTAGYELVDSPIGLAAWIVDKYRAWCDCDGNPEKEFTKDDLLTNIMVYWVTETGASAGRIYRESRRDVKFSGKVETPTGYAVFPKNMTLPPRRWMEARYNVTRWTEMPRGGHFAALEEPELFVRDVRAFFQQFR